ncbi:MAG TPA: tetratricopeptide repeat protein, partial [Thermoplasmata archaeon]|nr:tetratricopeptide repeat protein [Thermoplasmata archaeon]
IKPTYAPAWRAKGRALRTAGNASAALDCYAEALRHEPEDESSWFGLALTLHALGRRKEELTAYEELLRRNPRSVAAWMNKGVALHEAGQYAQAIACYDRILAIRPEVAAAWSNRGAAFLRMGRNEEALDAFDEALALDSAFADAAANRRAVLGKLGREVSQPVAFPPSDPVRVPGPLAGRVLANLGLPAQEAWRRSPPQVAEDFVALGSALLDEGNPEAALAAFAKAEAAGGGAAAALGRILALEIRGDPKALEEASRALEAYPDVVRVSIAVARVRESAGDAEGAWAVLEALAAQRPDLAWIWNWKGLLELRAGRAADARMSFEGATASAPDDADAWTSLAAAMFRDGDAEAALGACERALTIDPDLAAAWNNRAVILASMGRVREAEASFREAGRTEEGVAIPLNRAYFAETRGQHRAAVKAYAAVLVLHPAEREAIVGRRRAQGRLGAASRRRKAPKRKKR